MFACLLLVSERDPLGGLKITLAGVPLYFVIGFVAALIVRSTVDVQQSIWYLSIREGLVIVSLLVFTKILLDNFECLHQLWTTKKLGVAYDPPKTYSPWFLGVLTSWFNPYFIGIYFITILNFLHDGYDQITIFHGHSMFVSSFEVGFMTALLMITPLGLFYLALGVIFYRGFHIERIANEVRLFGLLFSSVFLTYVLWILLTDLFAFTTPLIHAIF